MAIQTLDEMLKDTSKKKKKKQDQQNKPVTQKLQSSIPKINDLLKDDVAPVKKTVSEVAPVTTTQKDSYFQKGALSKGFTLKNLSDANKATKKDMTEDATIGILGLAERVWDGLVQYSASNAYYVAESYNKTADPTLSEMNKRIYEQSKKEAAEYVAKDIIKEEEIARKIITEPFEKRTGINVEQASYLGSKGDALVQSASDQLVRSGLHFVPVVGTALATGVTGLSVLGGEAENAYKNGATYEEALISGMMSATGEMASEALFGGIKLGGKTVTDAFIKNVAQKAPTKFLGTLAKWGFNTAGEGAEEIISGYITALGQHLTYMDEKEINELFTKEDAWESFVAGSILGGFFETGNLAASKVSGRDYLTGNTINEQKVIDKVVENRIAEQEADGTKLNNREKAKIEEEVKYYLEKGYIDTDTIESVLGGETYESYKSLTEKEKALQDEIRALSSDPKPVAQRRVEAAKAELEKIQNGTEKTELKNRLSEEVKNLAMSDRLAESYNEQVRKTQAFNADLSQYDEKMQTTVKKAVESGILNNSNRTHEFVDMIAKLSADKGVSFDFTDNENLKKSGFALDGKTINGLVKGNEVILNVDSHKALNSVVGHEITHVLEGTELYAELQTAIKEYATTKGEYDARLKSITALYEGVDGANVEAELTADLIGDYLFTDSDFISKLSTENRNIFQKIYDEIKYLCKVATAGSKEAKELEKVKRAFEKAYRESGTATDDAKYSVSESDSWLDSLSIDDLIAELKIDDIDVNTDSKKTEKAKRRVDAVNKRLKEIGLSFNGTKQAAWTDERIDKYLSGSYYGSSNPDYAQAYITYVNPKQFLDLTMGGKTTTVDMIQKESEAYGEADFDKIGNSSPMMLEISEGRTGAKVIGHEGRHRMYLLGKAGFEKVPVLVFNYDNKYDKTKKTDFKLTAQRYNDTDLISSARNVVIDEMIPFNGRNRDEIISKFGSGKADADVRYSLADSEGNQLTKEQQDFFKDSKVRDENGSLKVMYHGSPAQFTVFDKKKAKSSGYYGRGFYFTNSDSHAQQYGNKYEVYLNIKNPLQEGQNNITKEQLRNFVEAVAENEDYGIENYGYDASIDSVTDSVYGKGDFEMLQDINASCIGDFAEAVQLFNEINGTDYDGIVVPTETVAFYPEQIKTVDNEKPTSDPDIRFSLSEDSEGRELSPSVKNRFSNSKAVDENGNLKVLYHGTAAGEFSIFDKAKGSVEGDFGSGFYFTDNSADVEENYEGGGADFENKVARLAEQIEAEEDIDYHEAEERARAELYKGSHKFEVYLNIEKPAIVGETILFDPDEYYSQYDPDDYDSEEDYEGEVEQLVADDIDNIIWDIERNVDVNSTDGIADILWNALNEGGIDVESLKAQVNELYLEDSNGNMVGNEVARQIIESLGYDGIIDPTVSGKWNMNMEEGTTHYIVFKPNQIKAVTNENPTDNPDIHMSLGGRNKPYGNYNVYGKDVRIQKDVAPMPEISESTDQRFSMSEDVEPTADTLIDSEESERIAGEDLTRKNADRIRTIKSEIEGYQSTRYVTNNEFFEKIAQKQSEWEALQRKDTKKATELRNQITRLEARRDDLLKMIDRKIERAYKRIETIENESRFEKRKSKQKQYRELFGNLMGDTSTWKDKKMGIQYQTNTFRRNLRDIVRDAGGNQDIARADAIYDELQGSVNRNEAKKNREANNLKNMFREMKINNTESTYIQMLGELRHNPDTTLTQDVVDAFYQKYKGKIDVQKVDKAIDEARKLYDSLYDRVNAALSEHGFKEMGYRKGYFPHFTDPKQNWLSKLLNWKVQNDEIPTDIAGLTELFEPQRTWQSFDKHRKSDTTDYNFLKGLDNYVNGSLDWIYHIEDIQKHRAFETEIRYRHSSEAVQKKIDEYRNNPMLSAEEVETLIQNVLREAKNPLNNFVTDLHTRTNILAGKKSSKDRNMESDFNRHAYSIMTNVTNRVTANQVVGSISSALTNFIPITQSWGQVNPTSSLVGMKQTIQSYMSDDGVVTKSDFLTNRLAQNEALYKDAWDKIGDKVGGLMEIVDNFTSQTVWRSKYYENIKNGMTEAQAIKDADQFAENVIGGRSKGNQPTIFHAKNPVTKMLTSFQLEVANQYGYMFKDMPQDIGKEAMGKLVKGYATMFVGAYAYNVLTSTLTGRDSAFDPIGIIEEFIKDLGGDDDEEEENVANAIGGLASNIAEEIPFVGGLLGGGRIPISSALPYNASIADAYADVVDGDWKSVLDEMSKPLYYGVLPMGGGQIRKTVQGLSMFNDDLPVSGSYTKSGNLRFPVEDTFLNKLQAGVFGQYASKNARDYFDNDRAPLKEKQIQEYMEVGMPIRDYWEYREGLSGLSTLNEKGDYIGNLDLPISKKNVLINNVTDRSTPIDYTGFENYSNFEEFDFATRYPDKYRVLQEQGVSVNEYKTKEEKTAFIHTDDYSWAADNKDKYTLSKAISSDVKEYKRLTKELNKIKADEEHTAKENKAEYINNLNLDYGQKIILYRSLYDSKKDKDKYNPVIVEYIYGRYDLSNEERIEILKELDMTVHADGYISW